MCDPPKFDFLKDRDAQVAAPRTVLSRHSTAAIARVTGFLQPTPPEFAGPTTLVASIQPKAHENAGRECDKVIECKRRNPSLQVSVSARREAGRMGYGRWGGAACQPRTGPPQLEMPIGGRDATAGHPRPKTRKLSDLPLTTSVPRRAMLVLARRMVGTSRAP